MILNALIVLKCLLCIESWMSMQSNMRLLEPMTQCRLIIADILLYFIPWAVIGLIQCNPLPMMLIHE